MLGRRDAGDPDRIRIFSNDRTLERQIDNLARLQPDESSSKIIGPAAKGPICVMLLSRPFHGCPNFSCALAQSGGAKGYLRRASRSNVLDSFLSAGWFVSRTFGYLVAIHRRCPETVVNLSVIDFKHATAAGSCLRKSNTLP